jgi:hypothetical protein
MNKRQLIIIGLMSLSLHSFSRDNEPFRRSLEIHSMPFALINTSPRFRFGIEYNVGPKLGYSLEIGAAKSFLNQGIVKEWSGGIDYSFLEIRPEIKYYFFKAADGYSSLYCATEFFYMMIHDVFEDDYFFPENSYSIIKFLKANYSKVKYGVHIKGGIKQLLFKRFDVDLYGGIGVAHRKIDYSNVVNPSYNDGKETDQFLHPNKQIGESVILHVTFGCKIGWLLFNK